MTAACPATSVMGEEISNHADASHDAVNPMVTAWQHLTIRAAIMTLVVPLALTVLPDSARPQADVDGIPPRARSLLRTCCGDCHSGEEPEAGLNLEQFDDLSGIRGHMEIWEKVLGRLKAGSMPPLEANSLSDADRKWLVGWIDATLHQIDCTSGQYAGVVTIRRLTRLEYRNSIRDLFQVDYEPAAAFPADDSGYGFDNIGDVQSLPPMLLEKYLWAAESIGRQVIVAPEDPQPSEQIHDERMGKAHGNFFFVSPASSSEEDAVAEKLISVWSSRCFRRPTSPAQVERLFQVYRDTRAEGASFEGGMRSVLQAILVSPNFLYKVELPPPEDGSPRQLDNFELATSLSYFLWSSTPDPGLRSAARRADFQEPDVLRQQVDRLLASPHADQLIDNFVVQWLQLRMLPELRPDPSLFAGVDSELLHDMQQETKLFVRAVLRENRSLLDLLLADFTFVNRRLAEHYGLEDIPEDSFPDGSSFVRVSLKGNGRRGLLTHGSFLTLTSNPTRTSPVKRGKWILENLLAQPPPPAPAEVMSLEQQQLTGSLRTQMEQHRRDPVCAACHDQMDPLGFALENYDAVGRWRDADGEGVIDASGQLPAGDVFSGAGELAEILANQRQSEFIRCITEKMLTYALGRGLRYEDQCAVQQIVRRLSDHDYRARELVDGIIDSRPFRQRQLAPYLTDHGP